MIEVESTRFGTIRLDQSDVVRFPQGLPGLDGCRDWVFLAGQESDAVVWLQSLDQADVALAAISPRRFLPDYDLRVGRGQLAPLRLDPSDAVRVLTILGRCDDSVTVNLKAPLVINLTKSLGCQVIAESDASLQHVLHPENNALRKSA